MEEIEKQFFFNVTRLNKNIFIIETDYNKFQMVVDEIKGIGIYLMCPTGHLLKTFKHTKVEIGLSWIVKSYTDFVN